MLEVERGVVEIEVHKLGEPSVADFGTVNQNLRKESDDASTFDGNIHEMIPAVETGLVVDQVHHGGRVGHSDVEAHMVGVGFSGLHEGGNLLGITEVTAGLVGIGNCGVEGGWRRTKCVRSVGNRHDKLLTLMLAARSVAVSVELFSLEVSSASARASAESLGCHDVLVRVCGIY